MGRLAPSAAGLAVAALLAASALIAVLPPPGVAAGWTFAFLSPERWLAAVGLGLAFGTARGARLPVALLALLAGFTLGIGLRHASLWTTLTALAIYPRLHLLAPLACALSGLVLILKIPWRSLALPVAAPCIGTALTLTAGINDPNADGFVFASEVALASLWLMLFAAILRRLAGETWVRPAERIGGSWLLAIGILLAGLQLAPVRAVDPEPPPAAPAAPGRFAPDSALPPEGGQPAPSPFGDPSLPRGTN